MRIFYLCTGGSYSFSFFLFVSLNRVREATANTRGQRAARRSFAPHAAQHGGRCAAGGGAVAGGTGSCQTASTRPPLHTPAQSPSWARDEITSVGRADNVGTRSACSDQRSAGILHAGGCRTAAFSPGGSEKVCAAYG
jgi:hypothetical protein